MFDVQASTFQFKQILKIAFLLGKQKSKKLIKTVLTEFFFH